MTKKSVFTRGTVAKFTLWAMACAISGVGSYAETTVRFDLLGDLPGGDFWSTATGVSADGSVVVGSSNSSSSTSGGGYISSQAFRWENGVMTSLGDLPGESYHSAAEGASADGSVVVGMAESLDGSSRVAFRWENGVMTSLGDLPGGDVESGALGASADGSVVVGYSMSASGTEGFRWVGGVMTGIGSLFGGFFHAGASDVSADGSVIVGSSVYSDDLELEAFRWENDNMIGLGDLPGGGFFSQSSAVSGNGLVVVGEGTSSSGGEAFRWKDGVMTGLGDLSGGGFFSSALGVSYEGTVVVGRSSSGSPNTPNGVEAVFWSEDNGWEIVSLNAFLESEGIDRNGFVLAEALGISSDGTTIVGYGVHPNGNQEAYRVRIVDTQDEAQGYEIVEWGDIGSGQVSPPMGRDFVAIDVSDKGDEAETFNLALRYDGSVVGWGTSTDEINVPDGNDFIAVAAGGDHAIALKDDGSIVCWGWDFFGQATPPVGNDFVAIVAGDSHNVALKTDGSIVSWGYSGHGLAIIPVGNDFVAIATHYFLSLALKADGSIVTWGSGDYGSLSPPAGSDFTAIAAGLNFGLALKDDGSIVGWGSNDFGQASPPAGNDFTAIAAGPDFGLALKSDGSIVGWGQNGMGQSSPPAGNDFTSIAAGAAHGLALRNAPLPVLSILQPPQSLTVAPGSSATFTVVSSGVDNEVIEWKHGDTVVGSNSPTLTIDNVQSPHSGLYKLTVSDGSETLASRTVTLGVKAPPYTEKLLNISTRGQILTDTKIMIAGFVLEGSGQKEVLIRGIGPTLGDFGVPGTCTDPRLELFRVTNPPTSFFAHNEAWGALTGDIPGIMQRVGGFALADGSRDAVLSMQLEPGAYTAQVSGLDGTGVGLVELYDADLDPLASTCNLANISTRGEVGIESQILIAGFVVEGEVPKQVLVRGIGPRLADFGVDGTLADPYLRILKNATPEALWVASNDNWSDNPNAAEIVSTSTAVGAFGLTDGSNDAVMLTWLEPGVYTAQVSGVGETTGVALVEVYEVK